VADADLVLVYDGECPVCSAYVTYVRIKESVGRMTLINARDGGDWVDKVRAAGLDLNEGMVLFYGDQLYHGADCVHMLALLTSSSGIFNRLNALMFKNRAVANFMYPIMRAGRNLLLRLLGRRPINNHAANNG
jgi:predicted DCC family thiol-disulfide oxidoreductase YuxK